MKDNYNPNLHNRKEQLAFAMGVFETKMQHNIGDDEDIFDEFLERLYEIGEFNIHHRGWMQELIERVYDKDNLPMDNINFYQEYEDACEKFKQVQDYIDRGCVAL